MCNQIKTQLEELKSDANKAFIIIFAFFCILAALFCWTWSQTADCQRQIYIQQQQIDSLEATNQCLLSEKKEQADKAKINLQEKTK